jgi:alkanesulfonate monooxygenase
MSRPEIAWFAALCDDDVEQLGVPAPGLLSSWEHCRTIVTAAEHGGFDNVLLPSGYSLGIDSTAFASAVATQTQRIRLLLAIRVGELVIPQLARQLATVDQIAGGRLTINVISSDVPGEEPLPSAQRYRRTLETMAALRSLLDGKPVDLTGEHIDLQIDPPRARPMAGRCPPFYFGGLSEEARDCAAAGADVYLMWPDTLDGVGKVITDVRARAARFGRTLRFGWRSHVIVRETEADARAAARRLVARLDDEVGAAIRARSLDSTSTGVRRQAELRGDADDEGYVDRHLWTGIGRARSGAGAAIVGDPDQVRDRIRRLNEAGIDAFILSGYPHLAECDLFARHVLAELDHGPLEIEPQPVVLD